VRRLAARLICTAAGSGGLVAVLAFPVGKIDGAAADFLGGPVGGSGPAAGSGAFGRENRAAGGRLMWPVTARLGSCQARRC